MIQLHHGFGEFQTVTSEEELNTVAAEVLKMIVSRLDTKARTHIVVKFVLDRASDLAECLPVTYASHKDLGEHMK